MSKTISIGFGIFALLLTGLLIIPQFVDLNKWKPDIEKLASSSLNADVKVYGDINLAILPFPGVTMSDVKISALKSQAASPIIQVEEVTITTGILPLFFKTLELSQINLASPKIRLDTDKDGRKNWLFIEDLYSSLIAQDSKSNIGGWEVSSAIPRINIQKGDLSYRNNDQVYTVSDFQTSLKSNSVQGPYRIEGQMYLNDKYLEFKTDIGEMLKGKPVDFDTTVFLEYRSLQVVGKYQPENKTFEGQLASRINPADVFGEMFPALDDLTLKSNINANKDKIVFSQLTIEQKDINVKGQAQIELGKQANVVLKLENLPGQTSLSLQGPFTKLTQMEGQIGLLSSDIQAFLIWLDPQLAVPSELKAFALETSYTYKDDALKLSKMSLALGNNKINGDIDYQAPLLKVKLSTPDLSGWLRYLDPENPYVQINQADFTGSIEFGEKIKQESSLNFANGYIKSKGYYLPEDMSYDLVVNASYPDFNEFLAALGFKNRLKLGSFKGKTRISGDAMKMSFNELDGSFKPANEKVGFKGSGSIDFASNRPNLTGDFSIDTLSLSTQLAKKNASSMQFALLTLATNEWSKEDVGLRFLGQIDGQINLSINRINAGPFIFKHMKIPVTLDEGMLTASNFSGTLNGGALEGDFSLTTKSKLSGQLKFTAKQLNWDTSNGLADIACDVEFKGGNLKDLVASLYGSLDLNASKILVGGFDAAQVEKKILSNQFVDIVSLLQGAPTGTTKFDTVAGRGLINKGIVAIDQLSFDGPNLMGKALGTFNLNTSVIDLSGIMEFKNISAAPAFKVKLFGPIASPEKEVDANSLAAFIVAISGRKVLQQTMPSPDKLIDNIGTVKDLLQAR